MSTLRIVLLGAPRFQLDGKPLKLGRRRSEALLSYLAVTAQPWQRTRLATLLWPDVDPHRAFANLRRELSTLRSHLPDNTLNTNEGLVWLDMTRLQLDVATFRAHMATAAQSPESAHSALASAVALYSGSFMDGFTLPDSPEFDDWQFFLRQELAQAQADALERLLHQSMSEGDYPTAVNYARQLLAQDPLKEATHRLLMTLYARDGLWVAATRQYEICAHLLKKELGVPPADETTSLYRKVKARDPGALQPHDALQPAPVTRKSTPARTQSFPGNNLPFHGMPLVGRARELSELGALLADPKIRLVTVVGPGGVGKTRLALEAATRWAQQVDGTVCYVGLSALGEPDTLVLILLRALGLAPLPGQSPLSQLLDYLQTHHLLLLLDNFEHLLTATDLLLQVVQAAPRVQILCTSRISLALQIEQLYPVSGLSVPPSDADLETIARADATRLFLEQARRKRPHFALEEANAQEIAAICRTVQGLPLALILAAAWIDLLPCADIVRQLHTGIDFLTAELHDLPQRQRSFRAVFESTWDLLTEHEQVILTRLALFHGSFDHRAAAAVTGANLSDLRKLLGASLLQRRADGRFELHELLRQFAQERLLRQQDAARQAAEKHAAHYMDLLAEQEAALKGKAHLDAVAVIQADLPNVRRAWQWAGEAMRPDLLARGLDGLCLFHQFRANTEMGIRDCEAATQHLQQIPEGAVETEAGRQAEAGGRILIARLLLWQGVFKRDRGHIQVATALWEQTAKLLESITQGNSSTDDLQVRHIHAQLCHEQGIAAVRLGDYTAAHAYYDTAERLLRTLDAPWELGLTLLEHATVYWHWNRYADGRKLCAESLTLLHELGNWAGYADALMRMSLLYLGEGQIQEAEAFIRRGMALAEERSADRIHTLTIQNIYGWVLILAGKYDQAVELAGNAMVEADDLANRYWASMCRWTAGLAMIHQGCYATAREILEQGLALSRTMEYIRGTSNILMLLAWLEMVDEQWSAATDLLQDSIRLAREIGHTDELAQAQVSLAAAQLLAGDPAPARALLGQAVLHAIAANAYLGQIVCLPVVALYAAAVGRPNTAAQLHLLACKQPFFAGSNWYKTLFGNRLHAMVNGLTSAERRAAHAYAATSTLEAALRTALADLEDVA